MSFDPALCEKYVLSLIDHEEIERALYVLDNIPAYYRDNQPENLVKLKKDILSSLCTTHAYMIGNLDSEVLLAAASNVLALTLRGQLLEAEVSGYNNVGLSPHIVDMGPGEFFIPLGLIQKKNYKFTYDPLVVDQKTQKFAMPLIEDVLAKKNPSPINPQIFAALEVIEHLPSIKDITIECLRHCGEWPERIHLSTPKYTYDNSTKVWNKPCGLPHLRAYTPREFVQAAHELFPNYVWQLYDGTIMSLRGQRHDKIDSKPLLQ